MELHLVVHNIRSAHNVGSMLRSADSLGATKVWIVGYSPAPDLPKVQKTALGAEGYVPWEQLPEVEDAIARLRADGFRIAGLELDDRAVDLFDYAVPKRLALVVGNEVEGIPPSIRGLCDDLIKIPQRGKKESLNVAVAAAIAMYALASRPSA
jgi:tRNA G18 (ribose-2'-O)-methylase SpoU